MKHIFSGLSVSALLLAAACTDVSELNYDQPAADVTQGADKIVTFTIAPQAQMVASRADNNDWKHGDGSQVEVMIFAIYTKEGDAGEYTISEYKLAESADVKLDDGNNDNTILLTHTTGNQVVSAHPTFKDDKLGKNQLAVPFNNGSNLTLSMKVVSDKSYMIVCWAQDSETDAFDTKDLAAVKVKYSDAKNNDEMRDAFCASAEFGVNSSNVSVTLRRPFAQINVGTAGWDYEAAAILKPAPVSYKESTVTISGVADTYNVLTATASKSDQAPESITFNWNTIPAFAHVSGDDLEEAIKKGEAYKPFENELFLRVDFDKNGEFKSYKNWDYYKNWSIEQGNKKNTEKDYTEVDKETLTETFKYLSMCYVLVPEGAPTITEDGTAQEGNGVLSKFVFNCKGSYVDDEGETQAVEYDAFTINNVPVQKNWRTNIVGFDFFTFRTKFLLWIVPEYCGDFTNEAEANVTDKEWKDNWHNTNISKKGDIYVVDNGNNGHGDKNDGFNDWEEDYNGRDKDKSAGTDD